MIDIKVAAKHQVFFSHYASGSLWYKTRDGVLFPVPISDTGDATFRNVDKGIYFMRWMKAWNKENETVA